MIHIIPAEKSDHILLNVGFGDDALFEDYFCFITVVEKMREKVSRSKAFIAETEVRG